MNECDLSTTVLMQSPFNLKPNDLVVPRYSAVNAVGNSDPAVCATPTAFIRTNACKPTNLVRDETNTDDKAMGGSKLCFKWDNCVDDDTVMFKFYYQAFNSNTNKLVGTTSANLLTDTSATSYCMDIPSEDQKAYHMWVEAYKDPVVCEEEQSEPYLFRHTQGPSCTGCFEVDARQCSIVFRLPDCEAMGGLIVSHPLEIKTKGDVWQVLNDVDTLDQYSKCNWNSWDKVCEVSMNVFKAEPFLLLPDDEVEARTRAISNTGETSSYITNNVSAGACTPMPKMKQLPTQV